MPPSLLTVSRFSSLVLGVVSCAANLLVVGPRTSALLAKRRVIEDKLGVNTKEENLEAAKSSAELAKLNKQFGMVHGISSLLNLFAVASSSYLLSGLTAAISV